MDTYAVIGLGRFGMRLARQLAETGAEVIAVDKRMDLVERARDSVSRAVALDATNEDALRAQGIDHVDCAIVGVGTAFEDAVLTTVLLKQLAVPRIIARATTSVRANILAKVGADEIINPEREAAERWTNRLMGPSVMERIELAEDFSLHQVPAPPSWAGKTLGGLDIRRNYGIQIVAIRRTVEDVDADGVKRARQAIISVPMPDSEIKDGDILLVIGSDEAMKGFPTA
jgi:trk system potassium uptake protein TrkA